MGDRLGSLVLLVKWTSAVPNARLTVGLAVCYSIADVWALKCGWWQWQCQTHSFISTYPSACWSECRTVTLDDRVKMPLGMEVGLSPGDFVLDGDPHPAEKWGRSSPKIFGPCLLWPNGWMDQDGTWHGGRPQLRRLCVRWGPSSPSRKRRRSPSPIFGPCLLWSNGWMDEDATW